MTLAMTLGVDTGVWGVASDSGALLPTSAVATRLNTSSFVGWVAEVPKHLPVLVRLMPAIQTGLRLPHSCGTTAGRRRRAFSTRLAL